MMTTNKNTGLNLAVGPSKPNIPGISRSAESSSDRKFEGMSLKKNVPMSLAT